MKQIPPYIICDSNITIVVGGKPYTISNSNASFSEVKNRIASQNFDGIEQLFSPASAVASYTKGSLVFKNGEVLYKGQPVHNYIVDKILAFIREGLPYQPLLNFLENLLQNPSFRAVNELYSFLESANLPITEDGCFLAYRKVREDYKDFFTGTINNSIGQSPKMARNLVDEEKSRTCSTGFHFCAFSYLSEYHSGEGRTLIVKINPANVVAIPEDYKNAKGRCCEYLVQSEVENEVIQNFGQLYCDNSKVAFNDGADDGHDSVGELSCYIGKKVGVEDANNGLPRNADEALSDVQDGKINNHHFIKGYNEGYDLFYAQNDAVSAPKEKVGKKTISEATRQKLRDAAARQRRDADGKYC